MPTEARPFLTTDPAGQELLPLLLVHFWHVDAIVAIVDSVGLPKAAIRWQDNATEVWPAVLKLAATERRMDALLTRLAADGVDVEVARQFRRFLSVSPGLPGQRGLAPAGPVVVDQTGTSDPYAAAMVGPRPLIDRAELRRHLKQMHQPDGSRVLVVSGQDGCGKSHTWFAISHLADIFGTFQARSIDLSQRAGGPAPLEDVMDLVASRLFAGTPAPVGDRLAQDETRINRFIGWLADATDGLPRPVWLVFDGFVPECASPSAQQLVTAIARAADRQELPKLRVTVLGFAGRAGQDVLTYALRDTPAHPQSDDLRSFFQAYAERHQVTIDDEGADVLLQQVLGDDPDLRALTMEELSRRAHQAALAAIGVGDD